MVEDTVMIDGVAYGFHSPEPTLYRVAPALGEAAQGNPVTDWQYRHSRGSRRYEWQARLQTRLEKLV